MGNNKMIVSVVTTISVIFLFCNFSFAGSSTANPATITYTDTSTPAPSDIGDIITQELGNAGLGDGYFRIIIPSDVKICNIGSNTTQDTNITRSTAVLGTSASPTSLYVLGSSFSASGSPTIYLLGSPNNYSIFKVSILSDGSVGFGISGGSNYVYLAQWSNLSTPINIASGEIGTVKVGEIYFNDTTNETVITLAAADSSTSASEKIIISGLKLKPATAKATGTVNLSILDKKSDGTNGIGITDDTTVKVMTMVDQSIMVSGTVSPSTVPVIGAGKVAAQSMGLLELSFVAEPSTNTSSTITFTLDNGAKFHSSASNAISSGYVTDGLTSSQVDGDFTVSSGKLVWTIANPQNEINANNTFQFNANAKMIDSSGITTNGDISCSVTGKGAFATVSQNVKVATAALSGTIVSFIDNNSPGIPTLYAGSDNQELGSGEYVLVGEKGPGSMLAGGTITVTLSNGAKFKASTAPIGNYTDATYQSNSFSVSGGTINNSNSFTTTLSGASSGSLGAFTVGLNVSNWLDLTNATAGDLTMTFSGNAGASGSVKIATIMATTTAKTWYYDSDGDGYGNPSSSISSATQPTGYVADKTDCNDNSASVHPGATEIAGDGIDQDCNGSDLTTAKTWYYDSDGDGYGDYSNSLTSATQPVGYISTYTDCNDNDASIHPQAAEIPGDNIDQDCDGKDAVSSGVWYYDSDGDGYGDSTKSLASATQPIGYVYVGTDCNDTDATIYPGATEIAGDGIDQDCNGSDLTVTGAEQISLLAPTNNEAISFGASGGKIAFSFSKIASATKYMLHFELNDIINNTSSSVLVELIPPVSSDPLNIFGGGIIGTPGFSESFIGMVYELALDTTTWDVLALYNIEWGIEAYDSSGALIGSSYKSSIPSKYASNIKFLASTAIALTSPSPGAELVKSDPAPVFKWALYAGATQFELILAHVSGASFDQVIPFPNLILNLLTMDDATWQSMSTGKWYWTVLGYDSMGNPMPSKFTIFDFKVQ